MAVRRRAAAEETQLRRRGNRVPRPDGDERCVTRTDMSSLAVDLELALAFEHDVDLLARRVIVPLRRLSRLERRLCEALRGRVVELPDLRAVLRRERLQ